MGTNYYVVENVCECCKRYDKTYHIGKSSRGWAFHFRGYKYDGLTTWQKWKEYLKDAKIRNEYGEDVPYDGFVHMVETYNSPNFVREDGRKNRSHNTEGRKEGWFDPENGWDDPEGYSFGTREFS